MSRRQTLYAAVLVSIACCGAGAAYAQGPVYIVTKAKITLEGCGLPDHISAVIGQDDGGEHTIKESEEQSWTVDLKDSGKRFDADATYARVYFGAKTTDCQQSHNERNGDLWVGRFTLRCQHGKARTLKVLAPAAKFHYVRKMNDAAACWQGSSLRDERDLRGFLSSNERVRLQFGKKKPDPRAPGLLLDDPAVAANFTKDVALDRQKVLDALADQRNRGRLSARPGTPSNALESDEDNLNHSGLTTLELRVKDN